MVINCTWQHFLQQSTSMIAVRGQSLHTFCYGIRKTMVTSSNGNIFYVTGPFVRSIHRSPLNSIHKGKWRGALMFSLISAWANCRVNNRDVGDLRRHRAHVMTMVATVIFLLIGVISGLVSRTRSEYSTHWPQGDVALFKYVIFKHVPMNDVEKSFCEIAHS